jgi:hypothetical protein
MQRFRSWAVTVVVTAALRDMGQDFTLHSRSHNTRRHKQQGHATKSCIYILQSQQRRVILYIIAGTRGTIQPPIVSLFWYPFNTNTWQSCRRGYSCQDSISPSKPNLSVTLSPSHESVYLVWLLSVWNKKSRS